VDLPSLTCSAHVSLTTSELLSVFKERVYKLEDENWDASDFHKSLEKSFEWGDRIPLGVLYKTEQPDL